jgi:hypothetical protein
MNTMPRCALLALAGTLAIGAANAQLPRQFPAQALRGDLTVLQPPDVKLNDGAARLSPGARIRGADNMVQMSGSLVGQKLRVHYTLDASGDLRDVWVLTPAEARVEPWPKTPAEAQRWFFDWSGQAWTKR